MSERRSSRAKKAISYTGFDDQSDDDFADATPPPPKKPKSTKNDDIVKKPKIKIEENVSVITENIFSSKSLDSAKKRRAPLSEKIYERELQEALQLSMLETGGSQDDIVHENGGKPLESPSQATRAIEMNECEKAEPPSQSNVSESLSKESLDKSDNPIYKREFSSSVTLGTMVLDESIEFLGQVDEEGKNRRGSRAGATTMQGLNKKAQVSSGEENGESDIIPENSDDDDDGDSTDDADDDDFSAEDGDSDFDAKEKKKQKTKPVLQKKSPNKRMPNPTTRKVSATKPPVKPPVKSSDTNPLAPESSSTLLSAQPSKSKSASSRTSSSKAIAKSATLSSTPRGPLQTTGHTSLTSSWKPPAVQAHCGSTSLPTVKSPSSGLRLGLSRNQRVKPLHSSAKVS